MIYQFPSFSPPFRLWKINQLSDTCTEADREADGGQWREDGGGEQTQRIRMARVKLETYPFNMSSLSILSVKGGTREGADPTVQRPVSLHRSQLLYSSRETEMW